MTPPIGIYEQYEQIKQELCEIDGMTPEEYEKAIAELAEELGI